ncbi:hypothetical protein [Nocardia sp. CNY236]|uniref:hypothetical protein n=1 Tax=Nocardia sp. CNY236 TaxID=1169152 RepID=UPI000410B463|nr:hypothetical protein [Nocardia sp. CNY236]
MPWTSCAPADRLARSWRSVVTVGIVALVIVLGALGILAEPYRPAVATDRLGPDHGELVVDYLARARDSLDGTDRDRHWGLVSFTAPVAPAQISAHSGGTHIAQVLYQVTLPRVHTPLVAVPVLHDLATVADSARDAAWLLPSPTDDRSARAVSVAAARLRADCACAVGLVVYGSLTELRSLATRDGVRSVQALPADAVAGSFAVAPLLPTHRGIVLPGPDDGPIPQP